MREIVYSRVWFTALLGVAACGSVDSDEPDAAIDAALDAPTDAVVPTTCAPAAAWSAPQLLTNLNGTNVELRPSLSVDELTIYFETNRSDPAPSGNGYEIMWASRTSRSASFNAPQLATGLTVAGAYDANPMLAADGLSVFLARSEPGGARSMGVWLATRATTTANFDAPAVVPNVNSADWDDFPFLRADNGELVFRSFRAGDAGGGDLYRSTRGVAGFAAATAISELDTPNEETAPVLSQDGLTIFFGSKRADGGALGDFDIWMATRPTLQAAFENVANVPTLNTAMGETPGWVSPDLCRLYFASNRGGTWDLYVAERQP